MDDFDFIPFWNKKVLSPPTLGSFEIKSKDPGLTSKRLATILEKIIKVLGDNELLHKEAALTSRLLYRMKKVLYKEKSYKTAQKIMRVLRNYLSLDLLGTMSELRNSSYDGRGPSRQMLEWALVSLLRFTRLFDRLHQLCLQDGFFMNEHLTSGHLWDRAIFLMATISRIWIFSKYLLMEACGWYVDLKPFLVELPSIQSWLPDVFEFPENIFSWLGNPEYLKSTNESLDKMASSSISEKGPSEEVATRQMKKSSIRCNRLIFNEDVGEVISKNEPMEVTPSFKDVQKSSANTSEEEINLVFRNAQDIFAFVKKENEYRNYNRKKAITKKMNNKKWSKVSGLLMEHFRKMKNVHSEKDFHAMLKKAQSTLNLFLL